MKAALLPDRGVVKVVGDTARDFLNGLLTTDMGTVTPERARFAALLTPQGKIIVDCIVAEASPALGGGLFLDCPKALAGTLATRLNFYKLRAKVAVEDLSETLGVMAVWDGKIEGSAAASDFGVTYLDPRLPALGMRVILPLHQAAEAAKEMGAELTDAGAYDAHRIAQGVPRGGADFSYGDAFPHETDMDQLGGVDFAKGCYVGQEVVSRMEHRGTARTRIVAARYADFAPEPGTPVLAGGKQLGTFGSAQDGHGLALLRVDRVADALAAGVAITSGGVPLNIEVPAWARFALPTAGKAAE
jgi:folate-binding protein YgfZ